MRLSWNKYFLSRPWLPAESYEIIKVLFSPSMTGKA